MGEQRRLTLYKPPGWREGGRYPVIYASDGQYLLGYLKLLDPLIVRGELPPIVAIGMWSAEGQGGPYTRSQEYLPGFKDGARRYAHFQRYFLDEVVPFAAVKLGASAVREERMLFGYSDGGSWALTTALNNPELFGTALALSIGWEPSGEKLAVPGRPRLFFGIGSKETTFKTVTTDIVRRAQRSPGEVIFRTGEGGHEPKVWAPMFLEAVKLAFGKR
jgi:enterochelin esterase-like enzyme